MAGTIHGKIDCRSNSGTSANNAQECFKAIFDFLDGNTRVTRRAYNFGASGTGTGYWDLSTPFTSNAWALFEFTNAAHKWFLLIQYNNGGGAANTFGLRTLGITTNTITGSPGGAAVVYQMAAGKKSDGNDAALADIWAGTTNNNGADTIPTVVWNTPSGGELYVFPRSNNVSGTHATDHDNCGLLTFMSNSNAAFRYHIVSDDDSIAVVSDSDDDGGPMFTYAGTYTPRSGLTVTRPFISIYNNVSTTVVNTNTLYGALDGTGSTGGGIVVPVDGSGGMGVRGMLFDRLALVPTATYQPNKLFSPVLYDEWTMPVTCNEASIQGFAGTVDFIRELFGVNHFDTSSGRARAFFGPITNATLKVSIPWDSATTPGLNFTRTGITF